MDVDVKEIQKQIKEMYQMNDADIDIEFTDNIFEDRLKHESREEADVLIYQKEKIISVNGCICPPINKNDKWHILISKKSEKYKSGQWYSTLAHEMSHVDDYIVFGNFFHISYTNIMYCEYYPSFFVFSEYKAKFIGYHTFLCVQHKDNVAEVRNGYKKLFSERQFNSDTYNALYYLNNVAWWLAEYDVANMMFDLNQSMDDLLKPFKGQEKEYVRQLYCVLRNSFTFTPYLENYILLTELINNYSAYLKDNNLTTR